MAGPSPEELSSALDQVLTAYPNVPRDVAERLIGVESGGNPRALSPKGAFGMTQVMPGTWKEMGGGDPSDWREQLRVGLGYLSKNIDRFGGDVPLGVAAYHAGPGNVEKAGRRIPDTNDGIMRTADYVRKVAGQDAGDATPPRTLRPREGNGDFWSQYAPPIAVPAPAAPAKPPGVGSDVWNAMASGLWGLGSSALESVFQITDKPAMALRDAVGASLGPRVVEAVDKLGDAIGTTAPQDFFKRRQQESQAKISPEGREALDAEWWDDETNTPGPAMTNWRSWALGAAQSLPGTIATMLPGLGLGLRAASQAGKAAVAAGATKEAAEAIASRAFNRVALGTGVVLEGLQGGGDSAQQVRDRVMALDEQTKERSAVYKSLLEQTGGDRARATELLASDAATQAWAFSSIATGAFAWPGDAVIFGLLRGKIAGGVLKRFAIGGAGEALEEAPQSGLSKISENVALQQADPTVQATEGAVGAAVGGAAVGSLLGTAMGVHSGRRLRPQQAPATEAPPAAATQPPEFPDAPEQPQPAPTPPGAAPSVTVPKAPKLQRPPESEISDAEVERRLAIEAQRQPGDVGRPTDGRPFIARSAAIGQLRRMGIKDTHEVVQLAPDAFVIRPKAVAEPDASTMPPASGESARAATEAAEPIDAGAPPPAPTPTPPVADNTPAITGSIPTDAVAPPTETTAVSKPKQLYVERAGQRFPVDSLEDAAAKWSQFRDRTMVGASAISDGVPIVDQDGNAVARVSYNGKVWPPGEWHSGMKPLVGQPFKSSLPDEQGAPPSAKEYDYASTQINLPGGIAEDVLRAGKKLIPAKDLHPDGFEQTPHVTVKYGLHGQDPAAVQKVVEGEPPITGKITGVDVFSPEGKDYDVVMARVDSPDLHRLNAKIKNALPHTDTFPTYEPHVTIAYVKRGEGAKYKGKKWPLDGRAFKIDTLQFSDTNGTLTPIRLGTAAAPSRPQVGPAQGPPAAVVEPPAKGFDPEAFDKKRADTIKASKAAGNRHLDDEKFPAVETMRGKAIYYAHDPKVRGVIRTVDNRGNVYVNWSDAYSAKAELATASEEGTGKNKRTVFQTSLSPRDLKDYVFAQENRGQPAIPAGKSAKDALEAKRKKPDPERGVLLNTGEQVYSESGRALAPFPKVRANNPTKAVDAWLLDEARKEVAGDDYKQTLLAGMDPKRLSQSDRDTLNDILFGDERGARPKHLAAPTRPAIAVPGPTYGTKNAVFTADAAAKARETLRKKLGTVTAGIDPETLQAGLTLAGYHIEAGARAFTDYAKAMIADLGEGARPYLRSWYESVRHYPGFDNRGMTPPEEIDQARNATEAEGATPAETEAIGEALDNAKESAADGDGPIHHLFDPPGKSDVVRIADKVKVYNAKHGWMTVEEAKAKVNEWEANAVKQGKTGANSDKVVLSFFDLTGAWSGPWEQAGYDVWRFDIQNDPEMGDVNNFSTEFFNDWFGSFDGRDVYAILAACPCTDFASSGARHFAAKDASGQTVKSVDLVKQTLAAIEYFKPSVWALENPVGRIESLTGLPPWRLSFDPNHFGDPYTKKTLLWGRFNADLPIAPVEPTEGSKMHAKYGGKSQATKNARSVTPEGFAYSFFMANNAVDNPVMALANKYDRLDRAAIKAALDAGLDEGQINELVEDFYYQDLDDEKANAALYAAADKAKAPKTAKQALDARRKAPAAPKAPEKAKPTTAPPKTGTLLTAKSVEELLAQGHDLIAHPRKGEIEVGKGRVYKATPGAIKAVRDAQAKPKKERSDAQKARDEQLRARAKARRVVQPDRDSLIPAIIKLGGLKDSYRSDLTGEKKAVNPRLAFVGSLFMKNGLGLDEMATEVGQYHYLTAAELEDTDGGVGRLSELIQAEIAGQLHYSADRDMDAVRDEQAKLAEEAQLEQEAAAAAVAQGDQPAGLVDPGDLAGLAILDAETPQDLADADLVAQASAINEGAVERFAQQYAEDDAAFMAAIRAFLKEHANEQGQGIADRGAAGLAETAQGSGRVQAEAETAAAGEAQDDAVAATGPTPSGAPRDRAEYRSLDEYEAAVNAAYSGGASSRTTPAPQVPIRAGEWLIDGRRGSDGHEIEEVRSIAVDQIAVSEDTGPEKWADVARYADWLKDGNEPPPIRVTQHDTGYFKAMDHRRLLAHKLAGRKEILARVSWTVDARRDDFTGPTGLTYELAVAGAMPRPIVPPPADSTILQDDAKWLERARRERETPLTAYTNEDVLAREEEQKRAAEAEAKAKRDADNKARADAERDTFALSGSDRPADVMAAQGQSGLFEQAPATQAKPQEPSAEYQRIHDEAVAASRAFKDASRKRKAGEISLAEYERARREYDTVQGRFGIAFEKEMDRTGRMPRDDRGMPAHLISNMAPRQPADIPDGYKPAGEPYYRNGVLTQGYAEFAPGESVRHKSNGAIGTVLSYVGEGPLFTRYLVDFPLGEMKVDRAGIEAIEQAEPQPRKADPANQKAGPAGVDDVGENLWYNRRNFAAGGIRWDDIKSLNEALKKREVVKSKVWPRPDYAGMVEGGMQPFIARMVKQVYDGIANEPAKTDDAWMQAYIDVIQKVRDGLLSWARDRDAVRSFVEAAAAAAGARMKNPFASAGREMHRVFIDRIWPDTPTGMLFRDSQAAKDMRAIGGNRFLRAVQVGIDDLVKAMKDVSDGWPAKQEAWQRQGYVIVAPGQYTVQSGPVERYNRETGKAEQTGETMYRVKVEGQPREFGARAKADAADPTATATKYLLVNRNAREFLAFATHDEALARAQEIVAKQRVLKGQDIRGTNVRESSRTGPERRDGDRNVSSDELMSTFGFRGVNFGRKGWINDAERQAYLNAAYDGLFDLAEILGVPPKALSLNGLLGIAFGAQGRGGQHAAHFVPGVNEINLTKTMGAGTLAHEWGHALDHYFARKAGLEGREDPYLSAHASLAPIRKVYSPADKRDVDVQRFGADLRPEMLAAFKAVYDAMNRRSATPEEVAISKRSAESAAASNLESWLAAIRRNTDPKDDNAKRFDALADRIRAGDLGEYVKSGNLTLPQTIAELREVTKQVRGRYEIADNMKGLMSAASSVQYRKQAKQQESDHVPQVSTVYKTESYAKDRDKGGKAYWATAHEMFARAFELYVADKITEQARSNTFLSDAQERAEATEEVTNRKGEAQKVYRNPYPRGADREATRAAFDALVAAIETRETEQGIALNALDFDDVLQSLDKRAVGYPRSAGEPISSLEYDSRTYKGSPYYKPAKEGDVDAAVKFVRGMVAPSTVAEAERRFGKDVIYVAPMAQEAAGRNAIPDVLARYYAKATGASVDTGIIQANTAYHTDESMMGRLLHRPLFEGHVQAGARYVVVDDVTTSGSSLAELADHIIASGGQIAGAIVLADARRGGSIHPARGVIEQLTRRFGDAIREIFNVEPAALTGQEAGYLIGFRDADEIRKGATAAAQERRSRLAKKGISERPRSVGAAAPTRTPADAGVSVSGAPHVSRWRVESDGPASDRTHYAVRDNSDKPTGVERRDFKTAAEAREFAARENARAVDLNALDMAPAPVWRSALQEALPKAPWSKAGDLEAAQRGFAITDKMRAAAGQGLPLFAPSKTPGRDFQAEATELVSIHEWKDVGEAFEWINDDRSWGDEYAAAAARAIYDARGGDAYGGSQAVAEFVRDVLERGYAIQVTEEGGTPLLAPTRMEPIVSGVEQSPAFKAATQRAIDQIEKLQESGRVDEARAAMMQLLNAKRRAPGIMTAERIYDAATAGQIDPESAALAVWLLDRAPHLANGAGLAIEPGYDGSSAGSYNRVSRLITLFSGRKPNGQFRGDHTTAVHEFMHHAERMMPEEVQDGIRNEWARRLTDFETWGQNVDSAVARRFIRDVLLMNAGDREAQKRANRMILDDEVPMGAAYQLTNPSEFWAENAARILSDRRFAEQNGWVEKARQWLAELIEQIKDILGLPSDAPILRALKQVLEGTGEQATHRMMYDDPGNRALARSRQDVYPAMDRPDSTPKSMRAAIKAQVVTDVGHRFMNRLRDLRPLGLQGLGRRQITEIYGDDLPALREYNELAQAMDAEKNESGAAADTLVRDWAKLKDEKALADLMHDATLAGIDPDKVRALPQYRDAELTRRFNALTPEAKAVYRRARDMYADHYKAVQEAVKAKVKRTLPDNQRRAELLQRMDENLFRAIKGVYFPLSRFGEYLVTVKKADGTQEAMSMAETLTEAEEVRRAMLAKFPPEKGYHVSKVLKRKEYNAARDAVGRAFLQDLFGVLDQFEVSDDLIDSINQLYLVSLPDLSWAKHGIHRKGTPGFSQDARRAYASNMFHGARYLAKLHYADRLNDWLRTAQEQVNVRHDDAAYDSIAAQQVVDEMHKRHDLLMNPKTSQLATNLTSLGFVWHLGLSPASAVVNMLQTPMVAYPILAARYGWTQAGRALMAASKQTTAAANDLTGKLSGDEARAFDQAVKDGVIDVTLAHDLAGVASGEDEKAHWKLRPVMRAASFLFHHAERFNRQATFLAAYRLARGKGMAHAEAYARAAEDTYAGHFDYSAGNRPRVMQGDVARVLLLFKQFGQNMIYTMARAAYKAAKGDREAAKVLAGILTTHALGAGLLGLPLVGPLLWAASLIGGDDDDPWDAEVALRNLLADAIGQKPAEVLVHGLSRVTPWDISGRIGLNTLIFPDIREGLQGADLGREIGMTFLGPVAAIPVNALTGLEDIGRGNIVRGLEGMSPVVIRGAMRALRYGTEGAKDRTGVELVPDVSIAEWLGQSAGFSPGRVREAQEAKGAIYQAEKFLNERRRTLLTQYAHAKQAGDVEGAQDAVEAIKLFNSRHPDRKITPDALAKSLRMRNKRQLEAEHGIYLPKRHRDLNELGRFAAGD